MGKGSSSAARRAQKSRNSSKKNEKEEKKESPISTTDHQSQSNTQNEENNHEPLKLDRGSSNTQDSESIENQEYEKNSSQGTNLAASEEANLRSSIDTHPTSLDHVSEPEIRSTHANDPEPVSAKSSNEMELETLREQIRALESELRELQQTLAESHQAFAEQIVQMSATKDQEKDNELLQLKEDWERSQSDLRIQTARVHTLEKQLEDRDKTLEEKSSMIAEHSAAMADMQAKITVRQKILFQDIVSKARAPTTESLAKVAFDLGYTKESDYLHAAHNAKYMALHAHSRQLQQMMGENIVKTMDAIEKALEPVDAATREAVLSPLRSLRTGWEASLSSGETTLGRIDA